jgi:hypothetical protein
MSFHQRLGLLMAVLGLSNSSLARALSVDPSLVSRWRTGARTPGKNSGHAEAIAEFAVRQAKRESQRAALREVMGLPPYEREADPAALARRLRAWLVEEAGAGEEAVAGFVDRLAVFGAPQVAPPRSGATPEGPAGLPHQGEVFYGIEGKRRGVLRFLSAVAARPRPGLLLLYSDEGMEWMTGDRAFLQELVAMFFEVLARGNRVKMVHVVSRELAEMLAAIDFWLPFYLTGAVEPYYCPRYREHFFRRTMFVAPGTAALTCATLAGREKDAPNFFFADRATVEALTAEFQALLDLCRPLMRIFAGENPLGLAELVTEFEEQPAEGLCRAPTLTCATMPEGLFGDLLRRAGLDGPGGENLLAVQRSRAAALRKNLGRCRYTEILDLPGPGEIAAGAVPVEALDLFGGPGLCYTPREYRRHLENVLGLLETHPNYHFYIARRTAPQNVRVAVKEEVGVIVAKTDAPPIVFAFNQQNMTNAFCCYLEEIIAGLPPEARNREGVKARLRTLADQLTD